MQRARPPSCIGSIWGKEEEEETATDEPGLVCNCSLALTLFFPTTTTPPLGGAGCFRENMCTIPTIGFNVERVQYKTIEVSSRSPLMLASRGVGADARAICKPIALDSHVWKRSAGRRGRPKGCSLRRVVWALAAVVSGC